jgi:endonuclease G
MGTDLHLKRLTAVDRMPIAPTLPTARVASTWRRLRTPQDLDVDVELNG